MKKFLAICLQLSALGLFAQAPQLINYQGVARDQFGVPIGNRTISLKFDLSQFTATNVVFTETISVTTNSLGLFTTQIGKSTSNGVGGVNFDAGSLMLTTSVDTTGGDSFVSLGTQSLMSVPYSMHAQAVPVSYTNNVLTIGKTSF